jgi:hypothetical protein
MTVSYWVLLRTILRISTDLVALTSSAMRSRAQLAAENLFLRKQLALYLERQTKPRRAMMRPASRPSRCRGSSSGVVS